LEICQIPPIACLVSQSRENLSNLGSTEKSLFVAKQKLANSPPGRDEVNGEHMVEEGFVGELNLSAGGCN